MTAIDETRPAAALTGNTFLEGNFAPIPYETTAWDLEVTGARGGKGR